MTNEISTTITSSCGISDKNGGVCNSDRRGERKGDERESVREEENQKDERMKIWMEGKVG